MVIKILISYASFFFIFSKDVRKNRTDIKLDSIPNIGTIVPTNIFFTTIHGMLSTLCHYAMQIENGSKTLIILIRKQRYCTYILGLPVYTTP
jgi:hypothetical protein